jgi:hypothetical protein
VQTFTSCTLRHLDVVIQSATHPVLDEAACFTAICKSSFHKLERLGFQWAVTSKIAVLSDVDLSGFPQLKALTLSSDLVHYCFQRPELIDTIHRLATSAPGLKALKLDFPVTPNGVQITALKQLVKALPRLTAFCVSADMVPYRSQLALSKAVVKAAPRVVYHDWAHPSGGFTVDL